MKASALRLGNLIHNINIANSIEEIVLICKDYALLRNGKRLPYSQIKGVPLTEEWLEKFGFEKSEGEEFFEWGNEKTFILQDKEKKYYYPYGSTINIEYVHQFQNLVFALTSEELQIKKLTT